MLITISGNDGSGKTSLATGVENYLVKKGFYVKHMRFPTSKMWMLMEILKKEGNNYSKYSTNATATGFAFNLERMAYLYEYVLPCLKIYDFVILERYILDFCAIGNALGANDTEIDLLLDIDKSLNVNKKMFFLDISHKLSYQRIVNRGVSSDFTERENFHAKVSQSYNRIVKQKYFNINCLNAQLPKEILIDQVINKLDLKNN